MLPYLMAGASLAQGIMGNRAANKQAKRAREIGEYNAKVAQIQSEAEQASIDFQSRQLVKQQREAKAQQRMSIAGRGGLETGTDLLSLIESAKNMQLDLLELERQQDIAQISGETQAQQIKMGSQAQSSALKAQGQQALLKGITGAVLNYQRYSVPKQPIKYTVPKNAMQFNTKTPTFQNKPYRGM